MVIPTNPKANTKPKSNPALTLNLTKAKQATDAAFGKSIELEGGTVSGSVLGPRSGLGTELKLTLSEDGDEDEEESEEGRVDGADEGDIDLETSLARLDQLGKNVKLNLKLRPIASPSIDEEADSPATTPASAYFTPLDEHSNRNSMGSVSIPIPLATVTPPADTPSLMPHTPHTFGTPHTPTPRTPYSSSSLATPRTPHTPYTPPIYTSTLHAPPKGVSGRDLWGLLTNNTDTPLLIDTRPLASHNSFHIRHSIPIAIPSLILKRSRKKGGAFTAMASLRQFITTEHGREVFDAMLGSGASVWNGNVIIYDEDMDIKDRTNPGSTPWALLGVIQSLLDQSQPIVQSFSLTPHLQQFQPVGGKADYLEGGIGHAGHDPLLQALIVGGGEDGEFLPSQPFLPRHPSPGPSRQERDMPVPPPPPTLNSKTSRSSLKSKRGPPSPLPGGLFTLDTHQPGYTYGGRVEVEQSFSAGVASGAASTSVSAESDKTVTENERNMDKGKAKEEEEHVLSSHPERETRLGPTPSPLPIMPSFSVSAHPPTPNPAALTHLVPPISIPSKTSLSPGLPADPDSAVYSTPNSSFPPTGLSVPLPLAELSSTAGNASTITSTTTTTGGGAGFKRPPPPSSTKGVMNKRSAPNLRSGLDTESSIPPPIPLLSTGGIAPPGLGAPKSMPGQAGIAPPGLGMSASSEQGLGAPRPPLSIPGEGSGTVAGSGPGPIPGRRAPKLSLNTGGVGGLGVGGERGTWGSKEYGGSLGRKAGMMGKLRSATVGSSSSGPGVYAKGGYWGDRESQFQSFGPMPSIPKPKFDSKLDSRFTAEPESISTFSPPPPEIETALSPTSNVKNPFQFQSLGLAMAIPDSNPNPPLLHTSTSSTSASTATSSNSTSPSPKIPFQTLSLNPKPRSGSGSSTNSNPPGSLHPPSPSHLNLTYSHHHTHTHSPTPSPPGSARLYGSFTSEHTHGHAHVPPSPGFRKTSFTGEGELPPPSPGFAKTSFGGIGAGIGFPRKSSAPTLIQTVQKKSSAKHLGMGMGMGLGKGTGLGLGSNSPPPPSSHVPAAAASTSAVQFPSRSPPYQAAGFGSVTLKSPSSASSTSSSSSSSSSASSTSFSSSSLSPPSGSRFPPSPPSQTQSPPPVPALASAPMPTQIQIQTHSDADTNADSHSDSHMRSPSTNWDKADGVGAGAAGLFGHARNDSTSSMNSVDSVDGVDRRPATAYFTPPHTPTASSSNSNSSVVLPHNSETTDTSTSNLGPGLGVKTAKQIWDDDEGTGAGGVHGTGHPPNLNLSSLQPQDEYGFGFGDQYDEGEHPIEQPTTPRTPRALPQAYSVPPRTAASAKPPMLSAVGFFDQDQYDDDNVRDKYGYDQDDARYGLGSGFGEKGYYGGFASASVARSDDKYGGFYQYRNEEGVGAGNLGVGGGFGHDRPRYNGSVSAYPASPTYHNDDDDEDQNDGSRSHSFFGSGGGKGGFGGGGTFGFGEREHEQEEEGSHPYGEGERSTSFSSLYPPPSAESENEAEDTDLSFTVSTILPGFLFLGPEPSTWDHVGELKGLGVRRIVNLAMECGPDDWGLGLDSAASHPTTTKGEMTGEKELEAGTDTNKEKGSRFEKYFKIPMRDTVEEDGIGKGVRMVCQILDHARLHSAPVYVHCKAGKSRSVTAVIAYLIHANHWPLSKAYSFVLERRKGISPNIGFVSELMGFEEEELGGKSGGVSGASWGGGGGGWGGAGGYGAGGWGVGAKQKQRHHPYQGSIGGPGSGVGSNAGSGAGSFAGALPQPSAPAATSEEYADAAKRNGVGSTSNNTEGYGMVTTTRKPGHVRESMPPPSTHHGYSYSVAGTEPFLTGTGIGAGMGMEDSRHGGGSESGNNSASSSTTASPELNGDYPYGSTSPPPSAPQPPQGFSQTNGGNGPSFPPLSAGGILALGDAAQELEVRDASGRYRHARRAPVNETTLQPMRRVSKAGLESGEFFYGDGIKMTWADDGDEEEALVVTPNPNPDPEV